MSQEDTQDGQEPAPVAEPVSEPKGEEKSFSADYVAQLRAEAAKYRTEAQEAKGKLTEREEAEKSDLEKAQSKLAKLERERDEATASLLRFQVASEKEVPAEAVEFLQGKSREELEASADKILGLVQKPAVPDFDGGSREPVPEPETPEDAHTKLFLKALGIIE